MIEMRLKKKHHLDASVAVKLVCEEPDSERMVAYFRKHVEQGDDFFMTPFCFYEALGALKRKYEYKKEIDKNEYFRACGQLIALFAIEEIQLDEVSLTELEFNLNVERIARSYDIDLSDALQIATVSWRVLFPFERALASIFITADNKLAKAAKREGLTVWNINKEEEPENDITNLDQTIDQEKSNS